MLSTDLSVKLYQSISEDNKPREMKHWHASSIASCPRAQYFNRLGVEHLRKPTAAKILRWGAGHRLETSIRPHIEKLYPGIMSNQRLTSQRYDLTGEYDNFSPETKTLVEIKSVHDLAFIERGGELSLKNQVGEWPNGNRKFDALLEPYPGHVLQNHAYALLLKEEGIEVENIDFIYLSLAGRVVAYKTRVEEKYINNVLARLEALNASWSTKTPPTCICREDHPLYDSVMFWCDYKTEEGCCDLSLIKEESNVS